MVLDLPDVRFDPGVRIVRIIGSYGRLAQPAHIKEQKRIHYSTTRAVVLTSGSDSCLTYVCTCVIPYILGSLPTPLGPVGPPPPCDKCPGRPRAKQD